MDIEPPQRKRWPIAIATTIFTPLLYKAWREWNIMAKSKAKPPDLNLPLRVKGGKLEGTDVIVTIDRDDGTTPAAPADVPKAPARPRRATPRRRTAMPQSDNAKPEATVPPTDQTAPTTTNPTDATKPGDPVVTEPNPPEVQPDPEAAKLSEEEINALLRQVEERQEQERKDAALAEEAKNRARLEAELKEQRRLEEAFKLKGKSDDDAKPHDEHHEKQPKPADDSLTEQKPPVDVVPQKRSPDLETQVRKATTDVQIDMRDLLANSACRKALRDIERPERHDSNWFNRICWLAIVILLIAGIIVLYISREHRTEQFLQYSQENGKPNEHDLAMRKAANDHFIKSATAKTELPATNPTTQPAEHRVHIYYHGLPTTAPTIPMTGTPGPSGFTPGEIGAPLSAKLLAAPKQKMVRLTVAQQGEFSSVAVWTGKVQPAIGDKPDLEKTSDEVDHIYLILPEVHGQASEYLDRVKSGRICWVYKNSYRKGSSTYESGECWFLVSTKPAPKPAPASPKSAPTTKPVSAIDNISDKIDKLSSKVDGIASDVTKLKQQPTGGRAQASPPAAARGQAPSYKVVTAPVGTDGASRLYIQMQNNEAYNVFIIPPPPQGWVQIEETTKTIWFQDAQGRHGPISGYADAVTTSNPDPNYENVGGERVHGLRKFSH